MNIKRNEIKVSNIGDYIVQEKRRVRTLNKQKKFFVWSYKKDTQAIEAFYAFVSAVAPCYHGWFCLCGKEVSRWMDKNFKNGLQFMGAKHYFK